MGSPDMTRQGTSIPDDVAAGVMRTFGKTADGMRPVPLDFWLCKGSGCPGHRCGADGCPDAVRYEDWSPVTKAEEESGVEYADRVFCPFARNGECTGGCPSNRERACVNGSGEDD